MASADVELLKQALGNGSFEDAANPLDSWAFSTPGGGKVEPSADARSGKSAAHILGGNQEWTFTNVVRLDAKPGQTFLATVYVKGSGLVRLNVIAWKAGKPLSPEAGSARLKLDEQWVRLEAEAVVPEGADQVQLQLTGEPGKGDLIVDDTLLEEGARKHYKKPRVDGWATERVKEKLDRGLTATPAGEGRVYVSWRLLDSDPPAVAFNLYRRNEATADAVKLNTQPLTETTDWTDATPPAGRSQYFVRAVAGGREMEASAAVSVVPASAPTYYRSIKLDKGVIASKVAIADLDGDGQLDFVIKQPHMYVDPFEGSWSRSTDTFKIEAYRSNGTRLWRNDLGWSIEAGVWYSPYVAYDFDGDGKAEIAVKTGEGDPRDPDGRVTSGPEWLSIWDGMTGKEITRAPWPSRDGFSAYNFYCRNQIAVAYLDGKTPCIIVERGTYNTIKVVAYQFRDRKLTELWRWSDVEDGAKYRGQGGHMLRVADVDGDGRDEVIIGSAVLSPDGNGLWSTGMGHPDQVTVGDLDPTHPGLEIAYGLEIPQKKNGICMVDAKTGQILWGIDRPTTHIHTPGLASDIDPRYPGVEVYGGEGKLTHFYLVTAQGKMLSDNRPLGEKSTPLYPEAAYWDGTTQRKLVHERYFTDFVTTKRLEPKLQGDIIAVADLIGDWREEVITAPPGELRIYQTLIPATDRRACLMQDPLYRMWIGSMSQGYLAMPGTSRLPGFDKPH